MWIDQWLVKKMMRFVYMRYRKAIKSELHKWIKMAERDRVKWLRRRLGSCGHRVELLPGIQIISPENVHIGNYVGIGHNTVLRAYAGITIGDFVLLGDNVILSTASHPVEEVHYRNAWHKPITIGENVWLAANVIVLPGVTIGENSAIGAGAVVTEDIPPNSVAVGVPARVVRQFQPDDEQLTAQKMKLQGRFPIASAQERKS